MITKFNTSQAQAPTATHSTAPAGEMGQDSPDATDKIALFVLIGLIGLATWKFIVKPEMERIRLAEESETNKND
jgi:hypothetical protein